MKDLLDPMMEWLKVALASVTLDPDMPHLAVVVLLMGFLPMTVVFPMTAACLLVAAALPASVAVPVMMAGVLLNTALAWGLARSTFGRPIERWIERRGGQMALLRKKAHKNPLRWAMLSRFIPAPFCLAPMVLASSGVSIWTTLLGTLITILPWACVYVWAARAGREGKVGSIAMAAAAIVLIMVGSVWLRRRYVDKEGRS